MLISQFPFIGVGFNELVGPNRSVRANEWEKNINNGEFVSGPILAVAVRE